MPDLRTRIIRSARLSLQVSHLGYFTDVKISELSHPLFGQEDVRTLNVSVHDLMLVQFLQAQYHLVEYGPYVLFLHKLAIFLKLVYL